MKNFCYYGYCFFLRITKTVYIFLFIESFLSLPTKTAQEWKTSFEDSCRNLLKLEGDLPVLKREAFQALVSLIHLPNFKA
jgi:hypothetical protein